ncbi:iron ABC transporter permease [Mechercharimyces sp. CAU 1602]|uniref:FecCD family ABC transporter permease n=1 Tax=Mechercharimyces sp. CAU 1602 TaxID=2973933 RepID=UPI0021637398|nr:iron ABC transporter permease [Mechercharimyces sp. CAU 1602]MCS1351975.1 iron ABC transporter permease [Mechercharimyces sp. CAU 1602]
MKKRVALVKMPLRLWLIILMTAFVFTVCGAVSIGSADISMGQVWQIIWHKLSFSSLSATQIDPVVEAIILEIRLPRVLLAGIVGAALAGCGVIFQGILRNPLADPYILGVSSGAAVGAVIALLTGWGSILFGIWNVPFFSFLFALIALGLVLRLSHVGSGMRTHTLILAGVVIQAFFGAVLTFMLSQSAERMMEIQFWLMGSVALRDWSHALIIFPVVLVGLFSAWLFSRELDLFALGERSAHYLGVSVYRIRLVLLIFASLVTGAAVAVSGTIGFVGLVVPHMMRMIAGPNHRLLLPVSILAGAIFLIWADTLARLVLDPRELPIGVITAFVGAPFFAWLLRRHSRE